MSDFNNFLDCPKDFNNEKLLIPGLTKAPEEAAPTCKVVTPQPGFCIKTKDSKDEKVFINICKTPFLPNAKLITDEELVELLCSEDPSTFRVPLSLGEPHVEMDKSGKGCTVYDVVINSDLFEEVQKREVFKQFLIAVALEGLDEKYGISLSRNVIILKVKKCVGTLSPHNIRTTSKPWILPVDEPDKPISAENNRGAQPTYTIRQDPILGPPKLICTSVHLPKVKYASSLTLDVGEDRILLTTRSGVYHMDIFLPFNISQESTVAEFNKDSQMLVIKTPVQAH